MSDVYYHACNDDDNADDDGDVENCTIADSPSCLNKMPNNRIKPKHKNVLNVESELVTTDNKKLTTSSLTKKDRKKQKNSNSPIKKEQKSSNNEINSTYGNNDDSRHCSINSSNNRNHKNCSNINVNSNNNSGSKKRYENGTNNNEKIQEYELADDAISLNGGCGSGDGDILTLNNGDDDVIKIGILSENDSKLMISVHGEEELPVIEQQTLKIQIENYENKMTKNLEKVEDEKFNNSSSFKKFVPIETKNHPLEPIVVIDEKLSLTDCKTEESDAKLIENRQNNDTNDDINDKDEEKAVRIKLLSDYNGNDNEGDSINCGERKSSKQDIKKEFFKNNKNIEEEIKTSSTLPKKSKKSSIYQNFYNKALRMVPKRITPDGTNIYYWCDLPKKALKG